MEALRLYGKNDIRVVDVPVPVPGDGEVLVRVRAAGICGTDIRMWKNGKTGVDAGHPITLGHEFAGDIEAVGKSVTRYKPGMRVACQPNHGCGVCPMCLKGLNHLCGSYKAFGVNFDGSFAPFVLVPAGSVNAGNLVPLPDGVTYEEGAIAEPLSCVLNGYEKMHAQAGETCLIYGAGPIGIGHAMLMAMSGVNVAMTDPVTERLAEAKKLVPSISVVTGDPDAFRDSFTHSLGYDMAITACPSPQAQLDAVNAVGIHGRVLFFGGLPADREPIAIDTNLLHYKELVLTGSTRSSLAQFARVLTLIERGQLNAGALLTHKHPMSDILSAFGSCARAEGLKHVVTF